MAILGDCYLWQEQTVGLLHLPYTLPYRSFSGTVCRCRLVARYVYYYRSHSTFLIGHGSLQRRALALSTTTLFEAGARKHRSFQRRSSVRCGVFVLLGDAAPHRSVERLYSVGRFYQLPNPDPPLRREACVGYCSYRETTKSQGSQEERTPFSGLTARRRAAAMSTNSTLRNSSLVVRAGKIRPENTRATWVGRNFLLIIIILFEEYIPCLCRVGRN